MSDNDWIHLSVIVELHQRKVQVCIIRYYGKRELFCTPE